MNKSKKTVTTEETKVVASKPSKKTNAKDTKVTKQPKKASVAKKTTKKATTKKPVAKKLPAKSKIIKKLIDAASPTKVSPRHSSESTSQVTPRILPKDAKVISSTPIVESMYVAYCVFRRDNILIIENIGVYNIIHLANQAIQAREAYHIDNGHDIVHSIVQPILVDNISKDKPTVEVYREVATEQEDKLESEVKESEYPKYEQCSSFKDVLVGWLTNRLYTPLK